METTLKLAVEIYASLTKQTIKEVFSKLENKDQVVVENVMKLMFSVI
jgi:flagellar motor switch protein FliG